MLVAAGCAACSPTHTSNRPSDPVEAPRPTCPTGAVRWGQVLEVHEAFLQRLSRGWLLSRSDALTKAMEGVQSCVHTFCDLIAELEDAVHTATAGDATSSSLQSPGAPSVSFPPSPFACLYGCLPAFWCEPASSQRAGLIAGSMGTEYVRMAFVLRKHAQDSPQSVNKIFWCRTKRHHTHSSEPPGRLHPFAPCSQKKRAHTKLCADCLEVVGACL